ncbi:unnamed protein product [Miscanthus lutarioriparius]|uniref:Uncharacterized protein n=1 Tax=Miscanthus lutarioriparius TaxID=422564 RepID=A0A811NX61_9POAL|nr:unnamed protein product [Miscanthus lutarioriparius]
MANSSAAHREAEAETHRARQGKWRRVKQGRVGKSASSKEAREAAVRGHVDRGSAAGHGSGRGSGGGAGLHGFAAPAHRSPGTTAHKDVKVA